MNGKDLREYSRRNPFKVSLSGIVATVALVLGVLKGCGAFPIHATKTEFDTHVTKSDREHDNFRIEQRIQHEDLHDVLEALGRQVPRHAPRRPREVHEEENP